MENLRTALQRMCCLLLLLFISLRIHAQEKPNLAALQTSKEKIQAWGDYCDEFLYKEDYKGLRIAAREGVAMTQAEDAYNLSLFTFYIGVTFNYSTESDSAVYYLEQSVQYGRKAKKGRRVTEALKQLLLAYNSYGKQEKREAVLTNLKEIIDTTTNPPSKALLQASVADYYATNGQYAKALEYQLLGVKARKATLNKANNTDSINVGVLLVNIAELYANLDQASKSIDYLRESEIYINAYKEGIPHVYKDFINAFLQLNRPDSALAYYKILQDHELPLRSDGDPSNLITSDLALAEYYLTNKELATARKFIDHASSFAANYEDAFIISQLNYVKGTFALANQQYSEALNYFRISEPVSKEGPPEVYSSLQKEYAEAHAALGNWQEAFQHLHLHAQLNDSLQREASKRNISEMEAKYQNEIKQEKIEGLSTENALQIIQLKNAKAQRIYFLIGLFLLLGIIASMIVIYRIKQRSTKLLEQKNTEMNLMNEHLEKANITKATLFSIISHDLRNPISQVYQFLDLQKTNPEIFNEQERLAYNEQISAAAGVVLETMEDLLIWSKTQMKQFTVSRENVWAAECIQTTQELLQSQINKKNITLKASISPDTVTQSDKNIVTIIVRNILQNAITYSHEHSTITIDATQEEAAMKIIITDEGAGMPERIRRIFNEPSMAINSSYTGLGLTIVKEMAELIGATIHISSSETGGTCISIFIPGNANAEI